MKTPKEWVEENTQSGAFDQVSDMEHGEELVREIQEDAIRHCWETINAAITRGQLPGNGCDETAQRNGLVIAGNLLMERISEAPNDPKLSDAEGLAQPVPGSVAGAQDVTARSRSLERLVRRRWFAPVLWMAKAYWEWLAWRSPFELHGKKWICLTEHDHFGHAVSRLISAAWECPSERNSRSERSTPANP